jgi:hypothetical protein
MRLLTLFKSDGTKQTASASLAAGTYYGELTPGEFECARLGSFLFRWDLTFAAAITFEATNDPSLHVYAAAASGWVTAPTPSPTALSTLTVTTGAAGVDSRYAIDLPFGRLRFKAVVGTAGALDVFENNKDG